MKRYMVIVLLLGSAGCNMYPKGGYESKREADQTRGQIVLIEKRVGLLEDFSEGALHANQRQDAKISGLRTDFDAQKRETDGTLSRLQLPEVIADTQTAMKIELKRLLDERDEKLRDERPSVSTEPSPSDIHSPAHDPLPEAVRHPDPLIVEVPNRSPYKVVQEGGKYRMIMDTRSEQYYQWVWSNSSRPTLYKWSRSACRCGQTHYAWQRTSIPGDGFPGPYD